ncbi:MAG: cysteine desulfurase family protein [Spirochaetaceae bacterium]|nr:cysteine desulfurase family protein [Spirochaetaceae bacterium]
MTYLDWAATALPDPHIMQAMADTAVNFPGNPSSPYPSGKEAKAALEDARARCAAVLGCSPGQLAFTSGGTEANAIVLLSRLLLLEPGTILISGLEHPSVAEPAKMLTRLGWNLNDLPPVADGRLAPEKLAAALSKHPDTRLAALMGVNNETGAVQPLNECIEVVREAQRDAGGRPIHFHADLVQAAGKISVNLADLDVDTASFSAHKFRGPRGVGLLYHRNPQFEAFIRGGGQEHGVRPGTENAAGAVAMAMALERWGRPHTAVAENGAWLLEKMAALEGVRIVPEERLKSPDNYAPGIISLSFPSVPGEVLARVLSESGYAVSTGSACSSNKKGKLPKAMVAMKVPKDTAEGMIRVSLGPTTTREELEGFLSTLERSVSMLKMATGRA